MSTNKTTNYNMHSWVETDYIRRIEFNENFSIIDSLLKDRLDSIDAVNRSLTTHAGQSATSSTDTTKNKHISNNDFKNWEDHRANKSNPHGVTAAQVGAYTIAAADAKFETIANVSSKIAAANASASAGADNAETNAINFAKGFGLGTYAKQLTNGYDLNELKENGFYRGSGLLNSPPSSSANPSQATPWFYYINLTHDTAGAWSVQIAIEYGSNKIFTRRRITTVWQTWIELETVSGAQSKADSALSSAKTYTNQQIGAIDYPVDSVNGKTGAVSLTYSDVDAAPTSHTHTAAQLPDASTSAKGVVQLSSATNSTSTTLAATASAVKAAYDLAASKASTATATTSGSGLMSSSDKAKLDGIAAGAQPNQSAFSIVTVNGTDVLADNPNDRLTLAGNTGITLVGDATNDKVTIGLDTSYTDGRYATLSGGNTFYGVQTFRDAIGVPRVSLNPTAVGNDLLTFNTERPWVMRQGGTAGGASLDLVSSTDSKSFKILSPDLTTVLEVHVSNKDSSDTSWAAVNGSRILTQADEGSGKGIDADSVDGLHASSLVQTSRSIATGTGLTGGGNLSANRTLAFDTAWGDARYATLSGDNTLTGGMYFNTASNAFSAYKTPTGKWSTIGTNSGSGREILELRGAQYSTAGAAVNIYGNGDSSNPGVVIISTNDTERVRVARDGVMKVNNINIGVNTISNDASQLTVKGKGSGINFTADGSGGRIHTMDIYNRTYGSGATVTITEEGTIGRISSGIKYKLNVEDMKTEVYDKILDLRPRTWIDKNASELLADLLTREANGETIDWSAQDIPRIERIPGLIGEEVAEIGLNEFVIYKYNEDGTKEVESLQYERLWIPLVPIIKQNKEDIQTLKNENAELKVENKKLQEDMEAIKKHLGLA